MKVTRRKAGVRVPSEWNGQAHDWPAKDIFELVNVAGSQAGLHASDPLAAMVADVLDSVAWALNRGDGEQLAALAKVARKWLASARPLISENTKAESGRGAELLNVPRRTDLDAYRAAVAKVHRDVKRGKATAIGIALSIQQPLPIVDHDPYGQTLKKIVRHIGQRRRVRGKLEAEDLVRFALLVAGIDRQRLDRIANSYNHRPE